MIRTLASAAALAAALILAGLPVGALAQSAASPAAHLHDPAQLQREHARALAAHDPANDPYNPHSANDLNRRQLERARAMGNGPGVRDDTYRTPDKAKAQPPAASPPAAVNSDDVPMNNTGVLPPPYSAAQ
ncbi:hypothetical protein [Asticcacaulis sp. EMRT-3]|uniref:hypothetical protein n=1 Tax=Asticcacaulis sp. EMRT-3 TaxID=3040349 RepID=UPI0024AFE1B9|nr:hypothetical protein [Asticcacaulis sp. EMRT-3]MDI7774062.1 hypothetical protein [Asticcacaulis sp. EMRT-3]